MENAEESSQLDAALERIEATMHAQPEQAIELCEQVFADARRLRQPLAHVVAAEHYGLIMDHLGRGAEARDALFEAMQVAQSARLFVNEARLLEQIARSYYTSGEYRQAIQYWARCVEVSDQSGHDVRTWILAKIGLGQVYFSIQDYSSGLTLLMDAQSRIHEVDDPHLDAKIKINIGVGLMEIQHCKESHEILNRALEICVEHDFGDYDAESNLRLAQVELLAGPSGSLDAAAGYLAKALPAARRVNYRWGESFILATQAEVFSRQQDHQKALDKIREAQAISLADGFGHMLIQQHFAAAQFAKAIGDFETAFNELSKGREKEQQMLASSASERNQELEEKAGLRPSLSRLLVELSNNRLIEDGQLDPAFQLIAQEGSRILDVSRVSIWLLDRETGSLVCRCLYAAVSGEFSREPSWRRKEHAAYFDRIADHNPVVAHDALHHPHTWELDEPYLAPRSIKSMLVFPIRVAGQTVGTVNFEAVGSQRNWTPDDIVHGNQLTEVAARVISSYERKQFQHQISALNARMMQANEMLEQRVMERTTSLERHAVEMHELQDKMYAMKQRLQILEKLAQSLPFEMDAIAAASGTALDQLGPAAGGGEVGAVQQQLALIRRAAENITDMLKA